MKVSSCSFGYSSFSIQESEKWLWKSFFVRRWASVSNIRKCNVLEPIADTYLLRRVIMFPFQQPTLTAFKCALVTMYT